MVIGEAIKGTRPWKIPGEGPSTLAKDVPSYQLGQFSFDHRDIRRTTKGDALYAFALGWPQDGQVVIKALRQGSEHHSGPVGRAELVSTPAALKWARTDHGREITVPWLSLRATPSPFASMRADRPSRPPTIHLSRLFRPSPVAVLLAFIPGLALVKRYWSLRWWRRASLPLRSTSQHIHRRRA